MLYCYNGVASTTAVGSAVCSAVRIVVYAYSLHVHKDDCRALLLRRVRVIPAFHAELSRCVIDCDEPIPLLDSQWSGYRDAQTHMFHLEDIEMENWKATIEYRKLIVPHTALGEVHAPTAVGIIR